MPRVNVLLPILLTGCVAGGHTPDDLSLNLDARCAADQWPVALPEPGILVDLERLTADIAELGDSAAIEQGEVVLTMWYATDGSNARRDLYSHDLLPATADSVQQLVFTHRIAQPEAPQEWGVRLVIAVGDSIGYDVARREVCPPRPVDSMIEDAIENYATTGVRNLGAGRATTIVMRIRVHPNGFVAGGRALRGTVPGSTIERQLVDFMRQFTFHPATIDDVPVFGEIDVPIRVGR